MKNIKLANLYNLHCTLLSFFFQQFSCVLSHLCTLKNTLTTTQTLLYQLLSAQFTMPLNFSLLKTLFENQTILIQYIYYIRRILYE